MRVLYKVPGDAEIHQIIVPNQLRVLQDLVGGPIETVTVEEDVVIICNEDRRLPNQEYNCEICGVIFMGPILIAGVDGEDFCDCPWSVTMAGKEVIK
jgi:hypothetical protein